MKSDATRITFDPANLFSRVILQQGRVSLDADHNEQVEILLHYVRTLARDLIGPFGGPQGGGFEVDVQKGRLVLTPGRYYVDGILVENPETCAYDEQPMYPLPDDDPLKLLTGDSPQQRFWLYLDVWERHVSWIEEPAIREVALGGPDTCTRSKVVWQLKALPSDATGDNFPCTDGLGGLVTLSPGALEARLDDGPAADDPCVMPPEVRYRGTENQLYRVEIHRGGTQEENPAFKWSRDNGSVATAIESVAGDTIEVTHTRGFAAGDWVELSDDELDLQGRPGVLVPLARVENGTLVTEPGAIEEPERWAHADRHPKVRRWDQTANEDVVLDDGAVPVQMGDWMDLEDGVQVRFATGEYRTGDYWLIPARLDGSLEWPEGEELPPRGIEHHYAPLGFVDTDGKDMTSARVCRTDIGPASTDT
jgi:hypothetical protein